MVPKELLRGTSAVLSSDYLKDDTLNEIQRPILLLPLALVFCCSHVLDFFLVAEI